MRLDHLLSKEKEEGFRKEMDLKFTLNPLHRKGLLFIFQCTLISTLKNRVWLTKDGNTIDVNSKIWAHSSDG